MTKITHRLLYTLLALTYTAIYFGLGKESAAIVLVIIYILLACK